MLLQIIVVLPYSIVGIIILVVYIVFVGFVRYLPVARKISYINSEMQTPLINFFTETSTGIITIRAFQAENQFMQEASKRIDHSNKTHKLVKLLNQWFTFRLELITSILVFGAALATVFLKENLSPGHAAILLYNVLGLSSQIVYIINGYLKMEQAAMSLERVMEYCNLEPEPEWGEVNKDSGSWLVAGEIVIQNFSMRYRDGQNLVLRDLNAHIQAQQMVGICGRAGAGKSSLIAAFFRLTEAAQGSIIIDGTDIKTLGLHALRRNLAIISKDPLLYVGTLRENLDPLNQYTDNEILDALERSHLSSFLQMIGNNLLYGIEDGGSNLSLPQRTLLGLARAILKRPKILMLDEATEGVDTLTGTILQETIRQEFKTTTVLHISHRLESIIDYDTILVLEHGEIVEYDSPAALLANPNGAFRSMCILDGLV